MNKIKELLEQVIWKSELDDRQEEIKNKKLVHGDGWITHHLKAIKKIVEEEIKNAENKK
jgi:hypothetical protein